MRNCVIFNPTAKGDKARLFREHLNDIGRHCAIKPTTCAGDAQRLAREAVEEGFETIVAAGGDGTVNEALNGLAEIPNGLQRARLAILPLGTVNVFARELRIPLQLSRAWEIVQTGTEIKIDLPHVEFNEGGVSKRRFFAQLAGAGLDARAVEMVDWNLKKKVGPLAYVYAGMKALGVKASPIVAGGGGHSESGQLVLLGNGRLYGGNYRLFPRASLSDGLIDVIVFPKTNWLRLLWIGPWLLLRGRIPSGAVRAFQAASVSLTSESRTPFEADGELGGLLPARFALTPSCLRVISPLGGSRSAP